jgi:glutamine synthetase
MTPQERAADGIGALPENLAEAVTVMEDSELVAEALGEHVFDYFIRNKRREWRDYKAHVSSWELDRYLGSL